MSSKRLADVGRDDLAVLSTESLDQPAVALDQLIRADDDVVLLPHVDGDELGLHAAGHAGGAPYEWSSDSTPTSPTRTRSRVSHGRSMPSRSR